MRVYSEREERSEPRSPLAPIANCYSPSLHLPLLSPNEKMKKSNLAPTKETFTDYHVDETLVSRYLFSRASIKIPVCPHCPQVSLCCCFIQPNLLWLQLHRNGGKKHGSGVDPTDTDPALDPILKSPFAFD